MWSRFMAQIAFNLFGKAKDEMHLWQMVDVGCSMESRSNP